MSSSYENGICIEAAAALPQCETLCLHAVLLLAFQSFLEGPFFLPQEGAIRHRVFLHSGVGSVSQQRGGLAEVCNHPSLSEES